jgi:hypothetical protein
MMKTVIPPLAPPIPRGGRGAVRIIPQKVIRYSRNAGDAHAAGAELQRSPQERHLNFNQRSIFPEKSRIDSHMKIRSYSIYWMIRRLNHPSTDRQGRWYYRRRTLPQEFWYIRARCEPGCTPFPPIPGFERS